jgi:hypothetical protein
VVRFICGLAHAKWKKDPLDLIPTFKVFPERWTCSITYGTPLDEWDLSTELRDSASDSNTEHLLELYEYDGYWKFTKNLISQRVNPILWRSWRQPMNVEDLVQYQDYQIKNGSSYPITLIWYPFRQRLSTPSDIVDLATATAIQAVTQTATNHKRTISEAIPAAERANGSEQTVNDAERGKEQVTTPASSDVIGPRRSGRARTSTGKARGDK